MNSKTETAKLRVQIMKSIMKNGLIDMVMMIYEDHSTRNEKGITQRKATESIQLCPLDTI